MISSMYSALPSSNSRPLLSSRGCLCGFPGLGQPWVFLSSSHLSRHPCALEVEPVLDGSCVEGTRWSGHVAQGLALQGP